MHKKQKCFEAYLKLGFTSVTSRSVEKRRGVLCSVVLSAESMKPSTLKRHLEPKHSITVRKDFEFFRRHEASLKGEKPDFTSSFQQENAFRIQQNAKQKSVFKTKETLVKLAS